MHHIYSLMVSLFSHLDYEYTQTWKNFKLKYIKHDYHHDDVTVEHLGFRFSGEQHSLWWFWWQPRRKRCEKDEKDEDVPAAADAGLVFCNLWIRSLNSGSLRSMSYAITIRILGAEEDTASTSPLRWFMVQSWLNVFVFFFSWVSHFPGKPWPQTDEKN